MSSVAVISTILGYALVYWIWSVMMTPLHQSVGGRRRVVFVVHDELALWMGGELCEQLLFCGVAYDEVDRELAGEDWGELALAAPAQFRLHPSAWSTRFSSMDPLYPVSMMSMRQS